MRRARRIRTRTAGLALLAGCAGATTGCIHNHYYGTTMPACGPTETTVLPFGSVCEVPTRVDGGTVVAQGRQAVPATPIVASNPAPSRVLISEPTRGPRLSWRRSDPEASIATTRVEGGLDDTLSR